MSRSTKKGPFIEPKLEKKVLAMRNAGQNAVIRTWSRASTILPEMIGLTIGDLDDQARMDEVFLSTPIRVRHTENYVRTFRKLLRAAESVDTDEMICDALLNGSAEGLYYRVILHARGEVMLDMGTNAAPPGRV